MSDNVVTLPRRDGGDLIWTFACGCTVHYHYASGDVECGSCGNIASGSTPGWRLKLPDEPDDARDLDETNFKVVPTTTADFFLRGQIKEHARRPMVAIVTVHDDGSLSTWSPDIDTAERCDWLERKLCEAVARIRRD